MVELKQAISFTLGRAIGDVMVALVIWVLVGSVWVLFRYGK